MKILFFHANRLGDAVVSLPAIQAVRQRRPDWTIRVVAGPAEAPLYRGGETVPGPRELTVWPEERNRFNHSWRAPWRLGRLLAQVRTFRPDACVLGFDQGNVAHWLARASGAAVRVGAMMPFVKLAGTLTHPVPRPAGRGAAGWSWEMGRVLLQALGAAAPDWPATPPPPRLAGLVPDLALPPVGIVVHAGASSEFTQWPLDRFAAAAGQLAASRGVTWIDRPETRAVALDPRIARVAPPDIPALVRTLAQHAFFLGNNSGPLHLASALGLSGLVVSGPTDPGWDPAWHRERWQVLRRAGLPCQPCQPVDVRVTACALPGRPHACLRDWTVAEVVGRVRPAAASAGPAAVSA